MHNFFISHLWDNPPFFFAAAILVIFSICCHEYMHARVALFEGDPTAADLGHLTLNPLKQMGVFSLIMFAVLGIAWGQVPVNHGRMIRRRSPAIVAFAGPATNFILGVLFVLGSFLLQRFGYADNFPKFMLLYGGILNFTLFFLNMMPVPGLDGWWILTNFFPNLIRVNSEVVKGAFFVMILILFTCIDYIFMAAGHFAGMLFKLFALLFGAAA